MRKLSFFKYAYLVFAILFFNEFIINIKLNSTKSIVCLLLCFLAVFMFFLEKNFKIVITQEINNLDVH